MVNQPVTQRSEVAKKKRREIITDYWIFAAIIKLVHYAIVVMASYSFTPLSEICQWWSLSVESI
jgi:hypothetical protein